MYICRLSPSIIVLRDKVLALLKCILLLSVWCCIEGWEDQRRCFSDFEPAVGLATGLFEGIELTAEA